MLLSWNKLQTNNTSLFRQEEITYFRTGKIPYTYLLNDNYALKSNNMKIHNLEKELFLVLNKISTHNYDKSKLSDCIYTDCCSKLLDNGVNMPRVCRKQVRLNKIDSIAKESLFGALFNSVQILAYSKEPYLKHWSRLSKDGIYTIVGR